MDVSQLPPVKNIGSAVNPNDLSLLLLQATGNLHLPHLHMDIVYGGSGSIRIFSQDEIPPIASAIRIGRDVLVDDLAERFFDTFMQEARFPTPGLFDKPKSQKGWQVQTTKINGQKMLIVRAALV